MNEAKIIRTDVFRFLETCSTPFDIIFADPPYELKTTDLIPDTVFKKKLLKEDGWLIIEHQSKRKLESDIQPDETRTYGNCAFSIFKNKPMQDDLSIQ